MINEDQFCIYCQKSFKYFGFFRRHIIMQHGLGLAIKMGLLNKDGSYTRKEDYYKRDKEKM